MREYLSACAREPSVTYCTEQHHNPEMLSYRNVLSKTPAAVTNTKAQRARSVYIGLTGGAASPAVLGISVGSASLLPAGRRLICLSSNSGKTSVPPLSNQ